MKHADPWWRFSTRLEIRMTNDSGQTQIAFLDEVDHPEPYYLSPDELIWFGKWFVALGEQRNASLEGDGHAA